jgi:hypothetical protein
LIWVFFIAKTWGFWGRGKVWILEIGLGIRWSDGRKFVKGIFERVCTLSRFEVVRAGNPKANSASEVKTEMWVDSRIRDAVIWGPSSIWNEVVWGNLVLVSLRGVTSLTVSCFSWCYYLSLVVFSNRSCCSLVHELEFFDLTDDLSRYQSLFHTIL